MKIEDKIVLSEDWENIYFFTEGIFAQVFGISLYLAIEKLGLSLKVCGYRYKKLNNELILRAGLPTKTLEKNYGNILIKRDFGYELANIIEPEDDTYQEWYEANLAKVLIEEQQVQQTDKTSAANKTKNNIKDNIKPAKEAKTMANQVAAEPSGARHLVLSEQEYDFLKTWQQDKYPSSIESGFIRGLHQKIACRSA